MDRHGLVSRGGVIGFVLGVLLLAPARAEDRPSSWVYSQLSERIAHALSGAQRWSRLPRGVDSVETWPMAEPFFSVRTTGREALEAYAREVARRPEGFRLLAAGDVIGAARNGEIVCRSTYRRSEVTIISGPNERTWQSQEPRHFVAATAHRIGDQWLLRSNDGLHALDGTPYPPELIVRDGATERTLTGDAAQTPVRTLFEDGVLREQATGEVIAFHETSKRDAERAPEHARIEIGRFGETARLESFPLAQNDTESVFRLEDGTWLAIGKRIVRLHAQRPVQLDEAMLAPFHEALTANDPDAVLAIAPVLTEYSQLLADSRIGRFIQVDSDELRIRALRGEIRDLEERIDTFRTLMRGGRERRAEFGAKRAEAQKELRALKQQLRALLDREEIGATYRLARRMAMRAQQLYDSIWIAWPKLLTIRDDGTALLAVEADAPDAEPSRTDLPGTVVWFATLDRAGHLELLAPLDVASYLSPSKVSFVRDEGEDAIVFVQNHGLLRVGRDVLTWIDQSERIQSMARCYGADSAGRLYFGSHDVTWVLAPDVPETERSLPVFAYGSAIDIDADGTLWFLAPGPEHAAFDMQPGAIARARDARLQWLDGLIRSPPPASRGVLCSWRNGRCTRYPQVRGGRVIVGADAARFVLHSGDEDRLRATIIHDGTAMECADLHRLAVKRDERLQRLAPRTIPFLERPSSTVMRRHAYASRTLGWHDDVLWISAGGFVEAYHDGQPLQVTARVQREAPESFVHLLGSAAWTKDTTAVILTTASKADGVRLYAALRTPAGYRFDLLCHRAPEDERASSARNDLIVRRNPAGGVQVVTTRRTDDGTVSTIESHPGGTSRELAGSTVLVDDDGAAIVATRAGIASGYAHDAADARELIESTLFRHLTPVAVVARDTLLCAEFDRPVWITRTGAAFTVRDGTPLPATHAIRRYIGQLADGSLVFNAEASGVGASHRAGIFIWPAP